ncbi:MAG: type I DNA topoisomerase [Clostridia bacterium]|nr:type I DNA topoisomerase [Clostridia bacterium]
MKLVIIEGIGKKDTIKKYLGNGYQVMATGGHFRDLKKRELSVDVDHGYAPQYVISSDKKDVDKSLKEAAAKAEAVLIATDPDREGEAIAYHLTYILGIDPTKAQRIEFNEITKHAISEALTKPRAIDMNLVYAQQTRRVLDRLVGYKLSPVLSKKIKSGLSAGRVQSVTLKLVVEREREIQNFKPEEYWDFWAHLEKDKLKFRAALYYGPDGKRLKPTSETQVQSIVKSIEGAQYTAKDVKKSITKRHAPAPFTTSSMQQDAGAKLGMSLKRTTMAAQTLYQGVHMGERGMTALVTYIRTDSVRVAVEAQAAAKAYITQKYGADFAPATPNIYKTKKTAQDAHEAIRPTHLDITPDEADKYCKPDEAKLYRLIYNRFIASQMAEATFNSVRVDIDANQYTFRVTGRTPLFDGWLAVYGGSNSKNNKEEPEKEGEDEAGENAGILPEINVGDCLNFKKLEFIQKFTQPPARYTEATLVKAMEEKGIGRPATYTPTIATLFARLYIEKEGKALKPTELGCVVVDWLIQYFPEIMNTGFTAEMEDKLDDIAANGIDWVSVVDNFYRPFIKIVDTVRADDGAANRMKPVESDEHCPNCGRVMLIRESRFGKFLACSGYPECKTTKPFEKPVCKCPKCGKDIYKRRSKKGKTFYGCSGYPNCDFVAFDEPTGELCPKCKSPLVKVKDVVKCSNRNCQ